MQYTAWIGASDRIDPFTSWDCVQCTGGASGSVTFDADEEKRIARGSCGGALPIGPNGRPLLAEAQLDENGVPYVAGDRVLNAPRFKAVRWYTCPLAAIGRPGCPSPRVPKWLLAVADCASWMNQGGTLRDFAPDAPSVFRDAVSYLRAESDRAREKKRKARDDLAAQAAKVSGRGRR